MSGPQLREMLTALRAECGHSTNAAHGLNAREALVYLLDRTQLDLWESYDWPMLQVDRNVPLVQGQRFYDYPPDLRFEDVAQVWFTLGLDVCTLGYDITPMQLALYNSTAGVQSWPPRRWRHNSDDNTFEIWPVPDASAAAQATLLTMRGTRQPTPLVDDGDEATLPWRIIVLTAAAEVLAKEEDPSSETKAKRAAELIRRLRVRVSSHKGGVTSYGATPTAQPRVGLDFIPLGYGSGPRRS